MCIHILHDDTIVHGQKALTELCERYGQTILFHRVPDFSPEFVQTIEQWFNLGTMYRFFVADFIDADKVIYLDCDIIVCRDIRELYDVELGPHLIGAVKDRSHYFDKSGRVKRKYRKKIAWLNITRDDCFNCGVMLINLKRMRELNSKGNIFLEATQKALDSNINLQYPDQDIMNSICASLPNGVLLLDESFNSYHNNLHLSLEEMQGRIVQFLSGKYELSFFPGHLTFWKYYAMSPFAADMIERMDEAYQGKGTRFVRNYIIHTKRRRKAADFLEFGFWGMIWRGIVRGLTKKRK